MNKELKKALLVILQQPNENDMEYAKSYATAGLEMGCNPETHFNNDKNTIETTIIDGGQAMVSDELKTQLLYILSNLNGWRGEEARETKKTIKKFIK